MNERLGWADEDNVEDVQGLPFSLKEMRSRIDQIKSMNAHEQALIAWSKKSYVKVYRLLEENGLGA